MRWETWVVLAAVGLALAGCTGQKKQYKYRLAVIPKGLTHQHWQSVHRGAERAAADLAEQGILVEVIWDGPRTEDDDEAQINLVNRHVADRVSGIVLAPQHSKTMVAPVERAVEQGIPVVIFDSGLDRKDAYVKYVATDNYRGGRLAAEHLLKLLKADGKPAPKLVLFRYKPGSESTEQREQGFEDHVEEVIAEQRRKGEPAITWLSRDRYAGATVDSASEAAAPLLDGLRDRGIDGIFAVNESSATGMLRALESLELNRKVRLVGFDQSEPLRQGLEKGDVDGLIVQDPYKMGYLGVWVLVQHLEGKDVGKASDLVSTGEYLLTRENLRDRETRERFDPELQKERKILPPDLAAKK
jgi:ribose transport system substrate-binding protein